MIPGGLDFRLLYKLSLCSRYSGPIKRSVYCDLFNCVSNVGLGSVRLLRDVICTSLALRSRTLSNPSLLMGAASHANACLSSSNAGQSHTHTTNRQAFYRHRIIPRMLVDTNQRDTATEIFGHEVPAPIGFAPVGINKIYNPQGELPVARAAGALGLPYCLSTAGSQSIEDVGQANDEGVKKGRGDIGTAAGGGEKGVRFFQLYMPHDDELTRSLLQRAVDSGFTACILTLDTWQLGWRHDDVANSNYAFYHGIGADLGLTDPVFQKRLKEKGIDPKTQPNEAGALWIDNVWHGRAHTWEKAEWAMKLWKELSGGKPFSLKGIQSVEDAKKAADLGFDGIVVSNHAGRQVDGAVASLDSLEKIVDGMFHHSADASRVSFDKAEQLLESLLFEYQERVGITQGFRQHGELISCDRGGNVRIWDLGENKCSHQLIPEDDVSVASVTVASDGSMVCAGNNARSDTTSILPICKFVAHTTYITRVLLSPDVRHLATCSADHTARIWSVDPTAPHNVTPNDNLPSASERDPAAFPLETTLHGHQRWVWDCAFSADSAYLVTSCSDHYARLWELGSQSIIRQYNGHHRGAVCVALNDTAVGN
ncbi:WD40 repeat-like protein [Alternaria alternata]|nr:WD40 repeat-like protein [Alternaria alternata]